MFTNFDLDWVKPDKLAFKLVLAEFSVLGNSKIGLASFQTRPDQFNSQLGLKRVSTPPTALISIELIYNRNSFRKI